MPDQSRASNILNTFGVILIAALIVCLLIVMNYTTESNLITVDVAKIQSKNKSRVIQEVALLTAEVRNLEKDIDTILEILKKQQREKSKKE